MKLSQHSKLRIRERTTFNHKERRQLFKNALQNGKSINDIKDKRVRNFINSKQQYNSKIKLYKDYLFIYSKNKHQLYTMYELPEELKGVETN